MGNFSRDTFDKLKHYVSVRLQQGVPILDADWNEMEDIRKHELRTFLKWFVGNGVPKENDGFRIAPISGGGAGTIVLTSNKEDTGFSSIVINRDASTAADALGFGPNNYSTSRTGSSPARLTGNATGLFNLANGSTLVVSADNKDEVEVVFNQSEFSDISHATAAEVVDVINNAVQDFTASVGEGNDFIIKGGTDNGPGRCLVEGWDVIIETDINYTAQPLYNNDALAREWGVDPLGPLLSTGNRTDTVYLDVWEREVGAQDDNDLVNEAIGIETCVRLKREWVIRVVENLANKNDLIKYLKDKNLFREEHVYYPLAALERAANRNTIVEDDITDLRRTGLAVLSEAITIKDGNVGIGTTNPEFKLDVTSGWFRFGPGGDGGRIFAEYEGGSGSLKAPILKLSDKDEPPRIQFQQTGNSDENNPQFTSWIGHTKNLSTDIAIMGGKVGIGTTEPGAKLDVNGGAFLGYETSLNDYGTPLKSGFYQNGGDRDIPGNIPDKNSHKWTHLITARHRNQDNNHQLQIASSYKSNDRLFFRKIANNSAESVNPDWHEIATRDTNTFSGNQLIKGNVGIGIKEQPSAKLHVGGGIKMNIGEGLEFLGENNYFGTNHDARIFRMIDGNGSEGNVDGGIAIEGYTPNDNLRKPIMAVMGNGNVGIGTDKPSFKVDVRGANGWIGSGDESQTLGGWRLGVRPKHSMTVTLPGGITSTITVPQIPNTWVHLTRADNANYQDLAVGALWAGGEKKFGTADDLAEMTPANPDDQLEPGDVVIVDDRNCVRITKSKKSYDARVAGVVSNTKTAGLVIGGSHPNDVARPDIKAVALAGRVLTKVTLENGPIEAGDFLTTSSTPGCAMKAVTPGYTLGKALEPYHESSGEESPEKIWVLVNLGFYWENKSSTPPAIGSDFAEYFESKNGKVIPPGTAVVLEGDKIKAAKKNDTPIGIISKNPIIVGGIHAEWPKKYLRDEFGAVIREEYKEEIMMPQKEKVKKEHQKMKKKKVKEKVTKTEIAFEDGKYFQKEITETVEKEVEEPVFEEVDLYDNEKKNIIGKHRIPVMETYEEEIDVLDENGQPVMGGTGKFETKTRPKINPQYDEKQEYIPREKRPEWSCVGLLGQLPLRKGQPVADTWVKIKNISKDVELWLVK